MNIELMQKIHAEAVERSERFFDGIEVDRLIPFDWSIDGLSEFSDPIVLAVGRERFEDGPPAWHVLAFRDRIDTRPRPIGGWPIWLKVLFLEHVDDFRAEYIAAIEKFEAIVKRRCG